jgi:hypothetical protein
MHGWRSIAGISYYTSDPYPIEAHYNAVARSLRSDLLSLNSRNPKYLTRSLTAEKITELAEEVKKQSLEYNRLAAAYFRQAMRNLELPYAHPKTLPWQVAWKLGILLTKYGVFNFGKSLLTKEDSSLIERSEIPGVRRSAPPSLSEDTSSSNTNNETRAVQSTALQGSRCTRSKTDLTYVRPIVFCKAAFLMTAYSIGFKRYSPDLSHLKTLEDLYHHSDQSKEVEIEFFELANQLDTQQWTHRLIKLDDGDLYELFKTWFSFRRCITQLLQNPAVKLPISEREFWQHFSDQLTLIMIDTLAVTSKNPNYDLDAINHLILKLHGAIEEEQKSKMRNDSPSRSLLTAMNRLQHSCNRLMTIFLRHSQVQGQADAKEFRESIRTSTYYEKTTEDLERANIILNGLNPLSTDDKVLFGSISNFLQEKRWRAYRNHKARGAFLNANIYCNQIYNYLRGYVELEDLPIHAENVREYLKWIKTFDLVLMFQNSTTQTHLRYGNGIRIQYRHYGKVEFPRTTHEIRKKLLALCPDLTTLEAFILTRHPEEMKSQPHAEKLSNWTPESAVHSQRVIDRQLSAAGHLAERMSHTELKSKIIAGRGISGSGKSTILERIIRTYFEVNNLKDQILNPDNLKRMLKNERCLVLNPQIHEEASIYFKFLLRKIVEEQQRNFVLDKRLLTLKDVIVNVVEPAKKLNCTVTLIDLHVDLKTSINRLLVRPKLGTEPCPLLSDWMDAAVKIAEYRSEIIQYALKEKTIAEYQLFSTNRQRLVAHIVNGVFETIQLKELNQCLRVPKKWEINNILTRKIDDAYIDVAIAEGDILPEQRPALEKWRGLSVGEAYKTHAETTINLPLAKL